MRILQCFYAVNGNLNRFDYSAFFQVECGTWHCAALVLVPPCKDGGYVSLAICASHEMLQRTSGVGKVYS